MEQPGDKIFITVSSELDGKKYKMVWEGTISASSTAKLHPLLQYSPNPRKSCTNTDYLVTKGDMAKVKVEKIMRYLEKACKIPYEEQILIYKGRVLQPDVNGAQIGLQPFDIINLTTAAHQQPSKPAPSASSFSTPVQPSFSQQPAPISIASSSLASRTLSPSRLVPGSSSSSSSAPSFAGLSGSSIPTTPPAFGGRPSLPSSSGLPKRLTPRGSNPSLSQPTPSSAPLDDANSIGFSLACENLAEFGGDIGARLEFDENLTCVVSVEEKFNILITYDPASERIYMYSTLMTSLPKDPTARLKLYEFLLEGALLGRQMAGGGVGVSIKNELVLMCTSIDVLNSRASALKSVAPLFVNDVEKWRGMTKTLLDSVAPVKK